jgi:hypothetical protein
MPSKQQQFLEALRLIIYLAAEFAGSSEDDG